MGSKPIQIVDEDDQPVKAAVKQEAWEQGLIHRVVRLVVENSDGQVLLQHRTPTKDIYPNCWDVSVSGHVDAGETYDAALAHEIAEELGFQDLQTTEIGSYRSNRIWKGLRFNRFNRCYKTRHDATPTHLEEGKIDGFKWFTVGEVKQLIKDHPDEVTDGLLEFFERYY